MTKIITCYHCGNTVPVNLFSTNKWRSEDWEEGIWEEYEYNLYMCPVCKQVTLEKESLYSEDIMNVGFLDDYEQALEVEKQTRVITLYPEYPSGKNSIPEKVKGAFEAALRVRNIDGAICAIAIRRTLEMMCKDKGAIGKDLHQKLKNLSEQGAIPSVLDATSILIKNIGNEAAHADAVEFDKQLISSLIRFTEIILEYVYVLPYETKKLQHKVSVRKAETKEASETVS